MEIWDYFDDSGTDISELKEALLLADKVVERLGLRNKPVFHVAGGASIVLHGIPSTTTQDIDSVLRMEREVRDAVNDLINDEASYVAVLPTDYVTRLVPYMTEELTHIKVYLVSVEDILISKLGAGRPNDFEDIRYARLVSKCDKQKFRTAMNHLSDADREKVNLNYKVYSSRYVRR